MLGEYGASAAIITTGKKFLLFHRDNIPTISSPDCWQSVGGCIEKGETPPQALIREVLEESSYSLTTYKHLYTFRNILGRNQHIFFALVNPTEMSKFKLGPNEGQAIGWFTLDEIAKLKLTPSSKIIYVDFRPLLEEIITTPKISSTRFKQILKTLKKRHQDKITNLLSKVQ